MSGKITKKEYSKLVKEKSPNSTLIKDMCLAFVIGGIFCVAGQLINFWITSFDLGKEDTSALTSASMIFIGAVLTGVGIYDDIARYGGGGTLVPITGFANSIVSPAIEYKTEGYILGVGAKMFTIAGPVIVYGTVASVVYGIIYWITTLF
jgi:stage V sporulation protein AC